MVPRPSCGLALSPLARAAPTGACRVPALAAPAAPLAALSRRVRGGADRASSTSFPPDRASAVSSSSCSGPGLRLSSGFALTSLGGCLWLRRCRLQRSAHRGSVARAAATVAATKRQNYRFEAPAREEPPSIEAANLPPLSADGGSQEEFEYYWSSNAEVSCYEGGWIERVTHPQVNIENYWFNRTTKELVWTKPEGLIAIKPEPQEGDDLDELTGKGREWEWNIDQLKKAMSEGRVEKLGLSYKELARRAVAEYEKFVPRVLSWHDFQHITFWFFGGMKKEKQSRRGGKPASFFKKGSGGNDGLFADRQFFEEAAQVIESRIGKMHPIPLCYFLWTFTRANVVVPDMMRAVGNHFAEGRCPMCDRCSLGTMVWNFGKQGVEHRRFFEAAAVEFTRPNRVRSLAPRNFQNTFLAYGWNRHYDRTMYNSLLRGMPRIMDGHRPVTGKLDRDLLFAYTCKDGSEVLADSFRISSFSVILKSLCRMGISGVEMETAVASMVEYVNDSHRSSPKMMRESGDACTFLLELAIAANSMPEMNLTRFLQPPLADVTTLCKDAPEEAKNRLRRALEVLKVPFLI